MSETCSSFAARCALRAPERLTIAVREYGGDADDLIRPIACSAQGGALRLVLDGHGNEWTVDPASGEHYEQDAYHHGLIIIAPSVEGGSDAAIEALLGCDALITGRVISTSA